MIVEKRDIAYKIAIEYDRRLSGVAYMPKDSEYIVQKVWVKERKDGKFEIFIQSSNEISVIPATPFEKFILDYGHSFDYDKFGLNRPKK